MQSLINEKIIIPKVKKNYVSNRSYIIRFKGVTPYAFMNRFVTALEDYDEFEKEITFDQKKLKILIKAQGFDKEEEEENESDEDNNNENNDEEEDGEDDGGSWGAVEGTPKTTLSILPDSLSLGKKRSGC